MEILTSLKISELEQIITASIQKCLSSTPQITPSEPSDRISIDEVCNLTGYTKPTIYKLSFTGSIPCEKFGKRLIFSRHELAQWMQDRTIRKQSPIEAATAHLQREANKKSA